MSAENDIFETGLERQHARERLSRLLGADTISALQQRSDLRGWIAVSSCWLVITGLLAICQVAMTAHAWWTIPAVLVCILFLGGRILALAILTHEGAHRTLFATQSLNDPVSDWLCGAPIFLDLQQYRRHHARHHVHTGTAEDVDLPLIEGFPTTRSSMARKFLRDLSGQTGIKSLIGFAMMNAEMIRWNVTGVVERLQRPGWGGKEYLRAFLHNSRRTLIFHGLFLALMVSLSLTPLFFLWWAGYLFAYPFCIRIRAIAEHAVTERTGDMLRNTRTTRAGLLARALFAPYHVNYHIEHHALVSVPFWQLPRLHRLLRQHQIIGEPPGYWQVIKLAASA